MECPGTGSFDTGETGGFARSVEGISFGRPAREGARTGSSLGNFDSPGFVPSPEPGITAFGRTGLGKSGLRGRPRAPAIAGAAFTGVSDPERGFPQQGQNLMTESQEGQ